MSGDDHPTVRKRRHPIGLFSWAVWGGGLILTAYIGVSSQNLWAFAILIAAALIGFPLPDVGPPHRWIIREWRRRAQWRRDKGQMMVPALLGEPKGPPCDIERVQGVLARVQGRDSDSFVPLLTDDTRDYATLGLMLSGASPQWLQSDSGGKFDWNLQWFEGIAEALGVTNDPRVEIMFTHMHRPADIEGMLKVGRVRYDQKFAIAAQEAPDTWEGRLGQNIADRIGGIYAAAGHPREYVFLRMPWPRGWRGKIGVDDADAFKRSSLYRIVCEIRSVYDSLGITAILLSPSEAQVLWDEYFNVSDLPAIRLYRQRDRELERLRPKKPVAESSLPEGKSPEDKTLELMMTRSLRSAPPNQDGYVCYGGTYHIAGYVTEIKRDFLRPAFRRGFNLDDDVFWTMTVHVQARLRDTVAAKAREEERALNMTEGLNPLDKGVTDVSGQNRWRDTVRWRRRLDEASSRVPDTAIIVSVAGRSHEEAEARWSDMLVRLATVYTIGRLHYRDEIEDALLLQVGVRVAPL